MPVNVSRDRRIKKCLRPVKFQSKKEAQGDIEKYRQILAANADMVTMNNIQNRVSEFKKLWSTAATSSEKNKTYRLLIDKIVYDRVDNSVTLEVLYK